MRVRASSLLLLGVLLAPIAAHADSIDQFSIKGGGLDFEVALPASTTLSDPAFGGQFGLSAPGTINGAPATLSLHFILPGLCAACDTIQLFTGSQNYSIGLPNLYEITYPSMTSVDISFIAGSYTARTQFPPTGGPTYTIDIAPEAAASTPEPASLWLVGTAALAFMAVRRPFRQISPSAEARG